MKKMLISILLVIAGFSLSAQSDITIEAPDMVPRFDIAEFVFRIIQ